jgi:hypothetical protein
MMKWVLGMLVMAAAGQSGAQVTRCVTPRGETTYSNLGCAQYEKAQGIRPTQRFEIAPGENVQPVLSKPRPLARSKPKPKPRPKPVATPAQEGAPVSAPAAR